MRIEGVVALVTGADRGVGAALVHALLARGATRVYGATPDAESRTSDWASRVLDWLEAG